MTHYGLWTAIYVVRWSWIGSIKGWLSKVQAPKLLGSVKAQKLGERTG